MTKISKVYYEELDSNVCTVEEAGEFYYHFNLLDTNISFQEYEKYELNQINLKNKIIGDAVKNNEIVGRPRIDSSVLAISSLKNKVIVVADIK